jgi:hypothetical protein
VLMFSGGNSKSATAAASALFLPVDLPGSVFCMHPGVM